MKKVLFIIAVTIILAVPAFSGSGCKFMEHGTMHYSELEGGCWQFVTDAGASYQPVGGPGYIYTEGLEGVLVGDINPDIFSTCMVGPIVEVCGFDGDKLVNVVGTLRFVNLETGCWALDAGNGSYQPISTDKNFFVDGAKVKVSGVVRDLRTICMIGPVFDVFSYQFLGKGSNSEAAGNSAGCQSDYAHCAKMCKDNLCFVSCETIYGNCYSGN